ncbi:MAG TPA: glycosyltransferase [Alphaproteobacteria bacterium]|jgi:glycosyltransferase involved in cell wall biosynthesis
MRLLAAMAGAKHGGAEAFFERLVLAFQRAGVEQRAVIRAEPARAQRLSDAGIKVRELAFGGWFDFRTRPALSRIIAEFRPAVTLSFMSRAADAMPAPWGKVPYVHIGRLGGYYDLKYFGTCQHLVANTAEIARYIRDHGWPAERVHYVPNFVDGSNTDPEDRAAHDTPADAPLLLALGRFHANKGFDTLLKALVDLPDTYLWLAGDGPEEKNLRALAHELDVLPRTRFLAWRTETAPLFAAADAVVVPSRKEPLGNVVIEAWARAKPVVASLSEGPRQLIEAGKNGLLVPIDDAKALAYALRHVIDETPLKRKFGEAGYESYRRSFTEEAVVRQYLELFARVAAGKP